MSILRYECDYMINQFEPIGCCKHCGLPFDECICNKLRTYIKTNTDTIKKVDIEHWIKQLNSGLLRYDTNDYLSKKHLFDYINAYLDILIRTHNLNIKR